MWGNKTQGPQLALAILVVGVAGCAREADVSRVAAGITPFDQLAGVRFQMTADELRAVRPGALNSPWTGFSDSLSGFGVVYWFRYDRPDDTATPAERRLYSVSADRRFDEDALADSAYRSRLRELTAVLGSPRDCFRNVAGQRSNHYALWKTAGTFVYAGYSTHVGISEDSARSFPASSWTFVSRTQPWAELRAARTREPCGSLL